MNRRPTARPLCTSASLLACAITLLMAGCDAETGEPKFPDHEQVGRAVDALLADPDRELPHALGPAVDAALFSMEEAQVADTLAPPDESVSAFRCTESLCVCAEGESIPGDVADDWSCDGMGAVCDAKGWIAQFPCTTTPGGVTICTCKKPIPKDGGIPGL